MIVDDVADMIFQKRKAPYLKADREPIIAVYIEERVWADMMREVTGFKGAIAFAMLEIYQTQGRSFLGCDIHRVLSDGHGIKVFEVGR